MRREKQQAKRSIYDSNADVALIRNLRSCASKEAASLALRLIEFFGEKGAYKPIGNTNVDEVASRQGVFCQPGSEEVPARQFVQQAEHVDEFLVESSHAA